jgi:hypothetical protein
LNVAIVEAMSGVNELMLRPAGIVFEPWATIDVVVVLDDDEQAAATMAITANELSQPNR